MSETIYALASAPGRAGVAVYRLSGSGAGAALRRLCRLTALPPPRRAVRAALHRLSDGGVIDRGLVLWFPAPASFTGEDVAELQLHGGRALLAATLAALAAEPGLRLAEPGEFSRRAFENGKLDLTAVEGLADLVNAETEAQRHQALRQLDGALGQLYESWRARLLRALAHLEADIDFPDEDIGPGIAAAVRPPLATLLAEIERHLADDRRGERLREGLSVVILGAPNVGKSSLLNALAQRDVAIVAATAGTTRDVIEVHLDLGGYPLTIADTAGLRTAADAVESEGIRRALARAEQADLKILVVDAADAPTLGTAASALHDADSLLVMNKIDLLPQPPAGRAVQGTTTYPVSAVTGAGMTEFLAGLTAAVQARFVSSGAPELTRARHRQALQACADHLRRFLAGGAPELLAEDVRLAARALGRITGRVDVEDLLDVIFRDFCIGK